MKNTARTLILLIALSASSVSIAQQGRPSGPPPIPDQTQIEGMVDQLSTELSLNDEQQSQISELYSIHFEELNDMASSQQGASQQMQQEMEKKKSSFEKEIKSVLTSEQKKKYTKYLKENTPQNNRPQGPPRQ